MIQIVSLVKSTYRLLRVKGKPGPEGFKINPDIGLFQESNYIKEAHFHNKLQRGVFMHPGWIIREISDP